ncbi:MAG: cytochrome c [Verrucomicrobiota bacterium]|nr:cytochrome c [Verrucomicrobiota bacterium]
MNKMLLIGAAVMVAVVTVSAADVKENWEKNCTKCHGADGKGDTKMGKKLEIKDFTDAKYQASMKDEEMLKAMKDGVKDGEKVRMKAVEGLSDDDMKALVKFVRDFKK